MSDRTCYELVAQLASGFGALLEQVQELDTKNANLEHLLDRMQKQVCHSAKDPTPGMKKHNSSRSGAAPTAVTDNIFTNCLTHVVPTLYRSNLYLIVTDMCLIIDTRQQSNNDI